MQTVLVSALTAGVVTLLIEYLAKPKLEARKERVLTQARAVREMRETIGLMEISIVTAVSAAGNLSHNLAEEAVNGLRDQWTELEKQYARSRNGLPRRKIGALRRGVQLVAGQVFSMRYLVGKLGDVDVDEDKRQLLLWIEDTYDVLIEAIALIRGVLDAQRLQWRRYKRATRNAESRFLELIELQNEGPRPPDSYPSPDSRPT